MSFDALAPRSLDETLFWLPSALKAPEATEWERSFVVSILGQSKRPQWKPSAGQLRIMERIVEERVIGDPEGDAALFDD